jgi:PPOX class probable F420-dependent enzyme
VPKPPVPAELDAFLAKPNPCIIATVRPDGSPVTVATWYDWEDGRVLLNMDEGRARLEHLRADPRVSLTVMPLGDWNAFVTLEGRVASLQEDADLSDIDRLSLRYGDGPFSTRDRRRVSAWIEIERWFAWHPESL